MKFLKLNQDIWKWFLGTIVICSLVCFPICALADVQVLDPTQEFISLLLQSLGGMKGLSTIAVVGLVVQLLLKLLDLPLLGKFFSESKGWLKLVIVSGLTMVSGVVGLCVHDGLSLGAALIHSTTLTAFMVFANQIWQHFVVDKKRE